MTGEERGALETRTGDAMPDRHPSTSPSGHAYGPPATDQQWAIFHRDMAPREAWQPEYSERVGLEHYRDLAGQAPSAAESRLTIERHGHTIEVDARGVSIDGQRVPGVSPRPLPKHACPATRTTPRPCRSPTVERSLCTAGSWPP